jgi:hypothetical protein
MADPPILGPYRTALLRGQGEQVQPGSPNVAQADPGPRVTPPSLLGALGGVPVEGMPAMGGPLPLPASPLDVDEQGKRELALQYAPMVKAVQDRRRQVEDRWLLNLDAWKGKHRRQGFKGEWFNHYIPAARRAMEKYVTRVVQMLFPSPDYFEIYPANEADEAGGQQAEAWKNFLLWRLTRGRIRQLVAQCARTFALYERAILKSYLDFEDVPGEAWPSVRAVDPFMFYVWPETASTTPQIQVCFEHTMMPYLQYQRLAQQGVADPIPSGDLTAPEWPYFYVSRMGDVGMTVPSDVRATSPGSPLDDPQRLVSMTEVWTRDGAAWTQFWLVWNVTAGPRCTRLARGVQLPYRLAVARQVPGEHYTNGMMSDLEPLNVMLNDQINMTLEGQATSVFPPAIINPDMVARADSLVFRPRAKWLADPAGIKWMEMPNMMGPGQQGISLTMGLIDQFAANSPLAEGTMSRGMPRAGFAVSSLIQLALSDIRMVAEAFEDELLSPMLQDLARLTTMAVPPQQIAQIPGAEALSTMQLPVSALLRGASFRWVGSLQSQDQQVRAQRLLTLLGQLSKIYPSMRQNGWDIDFGTIGKRLWRDGLGERGADTIILRKPPDPPQPPQSGPPKVSVSITGQDIGMELSQALALSGEPQLQGGPQGPPPQGPPPGAQPPGPPQQAPGGAMQDQQQMSRLMARFAGGPAGGQMTNGEP